MARIDRPLSRRAFFKAAGLLSAAAAVPAGPAVAEVARKKLDPEKIKKWTKKDGLPDDDKDQKEYFEIVQDLWDHFLMGTQDYPLADDMDEIAYEFPPPEEDPDDSSKKKKVHSGHRLVENRSRMGTETDLRVNTRYCAYLCGYYALSSAREATPKKHDKIEEGDYEKGWRQAKADMESLFSRSAKRRGEKLEDGFGGACT